MKLVLIHGGPAVGKLTVARELARLSGFHLFHNHLTVDLVGAVFEFGSEPFVRLREDIWLAVFREAARHDTSLIFTFAPEATVATDFVAKAVERVESAGGQIVLVELTCAEADLERRLTDPSRTAFGKLNAFEQYRDLKNAGAFTFPAIPSDLVIDTSNTPPEAAARTIMNLLERGGV